MSCSRPLAGRLLSPGSLGPLLPGRPCPPVSAGLEGVSWSTSPPTTPRWGLVGQLMMTSFGTPTPHGRKCRVQGSVYKLGTWHGVVHRVGVGVCLELSEGIGVFCGHLGARTW